MARDAGPNCTKVLMRDSTKLALERIQELGQEVLFAHEELVRWRKVPLESKEKTELSTKLRNALSKQCEWIVAILEEDTYSSLGKDSKRWRKH